MILDTITAPTLSLTCSRCARTGLEINRKMWTLNNHIELNRPHENKKFIQILHEKVLNGTKNACAFSLKISEKENNEK